MPKNKPERIDAIDGALGELSTFHRTFGFYVHGVSLQSAVLPGQWEDRLCEVRNENTRNCTGWCLEGHDLAASKLVAFRERDRNFVRVLLSEGLVHEDTLVARIKALRIPLAEQARLADWVAKTCQELE